MSEAYPLPASPPPPIAIESPEPLPGWWGSLIGVITQPVGFFARHATRASLGQALFFGMVTALLAHGLAGPKRFLQYQRTQPARDLALDWVEQWDLGPVLEEALTGAASRGFWTQEINRLLGQPMAWLVGTFLLALWMHLPVRLLRGRGNFGATVRVACYAAPAALLHMLPLVGAVLGVAAGVVLWGVGLQVMHRLSTPRLLAVLLFWPVGMALQLAVLFGLLIRFSTAI